MKRFFVRCYRLICTIVFFLRLKLKGCFCDKGLRVSGNPLLMIEGRGSLSIGMKLRINSNFRANPIGYNNPTVFWTAEGGRISIGNNVGMSNNTIVSRGTSITIGDNVLLGGGTKIYNTDFHSLDYESRMHEPDINIKSKPVLIKEGAFIGAGSIILKGVIIGKESIIGAGSVVTKSVPDREIWAGNPAKFIKRVNSNEK